MATSTLPVSGLINSTVNLSPAGAQAQSLSGMLVLGDSDVIDVVERMRTYGSSTEVASDFGSSAPEYEAAVIWFSQVPQPPSLFIGRWAQTATAGKLLCAALSAAQQLISNWTAITTGSFEITVDGTLKTLSALDFAAVTNLNGVASIIETALAGSATCVWNANYSRFEFESTVTGTASTMTFLSPSGSGTDISGMLAGLSTSSGAYIANGIAAETAVSAVTLFDATFGQKWYGVNVPQAVDADHLAIAAYIESASTKHAYGVTTQEAGCLIPTDTTNIAYQLKGLNYNKTWVQFSSSSLYAVLSMMARIMTTNFNAANTAITLMYKQEPGIVSENLNSSQLGAILGFNCNVFVAYDNNTSIIQPGIAPSGNYIDTVYGVDWLSITIQNAEFNALYTSTTKIPQTDKGIHLLVVTAESVCEQAVTNDLLGPGTWNAGGFGALNQGDYLPKGYYVYAAPLATQPQSARSARQSPPLQIAAKLSGAVQTVDVLISVQN